MTRPEPVSLEPDIELAPDDWTWQEADNGEVRLLRPLNDGEGLPDVFSEDGVFLSGEDIVLLAELATGATTEVAARHLELSARTLRRRLRGICDRLGVMTPIEAVVWAARRRII